MDGTNFGRISGVFFTSLLYQKQDGTHQCPFAIYPQTRSNYLHHRLPPFAHRSKPQSRDGMAAVRRSALLIAALLALCLIHESTGVRRGDEDADDEGDAVEAKSEDATMESTPEPAAVEPEVSASSTQSDAGEGASSDVDDEAASSEGKPPPEDDSLPPHFVEGSIACFLAMFAVTFFMGRSTNEKATESPSFRTTTTFPGLGLPLDGLPSTLPFVVRFFPG